MVNESKSDMNDERLPDLKEPRHLTDDSTKGYVDNGYERLGRIITLTSTNTSFLEDFISDKGYIKKKTLNETFITLDESRNVVRLVGVEISKRRNLRLGFYHNESSASWVIEDALHGLGGVSLVPRSPPDPSPTSARSGIVVNA